MSSNEEPKHVVTDKRGKKKEPEAPVGAPTIELPDAEPSPAEEDAARPRLTELRAKHDAGEELTEDERAEVLRLQAALDSGRIDAGAVKLVTAFLMVLDHEGAWTATNDVNLIMDLQRAADANDIWHGASAVKRDLEVDLTVARMIRGQAQMAQQMQQQMRGQEQLANVRKRMSGPSGR